MEGNPVAPAPASEAPINSNPAPAQAPAPAAPAAPQANIPAEQIEAFNRFVSANGGFETAFGKMKAAISNPRPQQQQPRQPAQQQMRQPVPQMDQQYAQRVQPRQMPKGFVTQEELAAKSYFEGISREEAYAPIAEQIRSGEIFKEMGKFGIRPVVNGMFNDGQVRDFLNLYAKTVPAVQTTETVTSTPTVDFVNVGEQVSSRDDALRILQQNHQLGGAASHPQTDAAKAFLKEYYKNKK